MKLYVEYELFLFEIIDVVFKIGVKEKWRFLDVFFFIEIFLIIFRNNNYIGWNV